MEEKTFDPVAVTRRLCQIEPSTAPERDREWGLAAIDRLTCWQAALRAELFNACQNPPPESDAAECASDDAAPGAADGPDDAAAFSGADPLGDDTGHDSAAGQSGGTDDAAPPPLDRSAPLTWRERLKLERRAEMLAVAELFGAALRGGRIAPDHADVLASVLREVKAPIRERVLARQADLVVLAQRLSPPQFANALRRAIDRASAEEGLSLAARLLANTRLRQWDGDDGLHHVHVALDPEHAGLFNAALQAEVEALFHGGEHPDLDHEQRAARALVNLVTSGQGAPRRSDPSRAQFLILADVDTLFDDLHDTSVLETAGGRSIHLETARRLWCDAESVTWVLALKGNVLSLVTEDELANRNQRRAMRSMYRGCVYPNCGVAFDRCHLHHVVFRHRGGKTVISNLLPVCYRHHHLVHEGGWKLTMNTARTIEWHRPDGTLHARIVHTPIGVDDQLANGPPGTSPPGSAGQRGTSPPGESPPGSAGERGKSPPGESPPGSGGRRGKSPPGESPPGSGGRRAKPTPGESPPGGNRKPAAGSSTRQTALFDPPAA
jgi:hypothetical protein